MNEMTKKCALSAVLTEFGASINTRIARTRGFLRHEIMPLFVGSRAHAKRNVTKVLLSWGCLALAVVLVSKPCTSGQRLIETHDWNLPEFVNHLNAHGLALYVVPTHKSGKWSNSIYLTTDPQGCWQSFQHKTRNIEKLDQWHGVVLVERMTNELGPQWDVSQWGKNGLQIDRFVFFGDAELIQQIGQSVMVAQPRCIISRLLSCP
jgi:hypothetical protein